MNQNSTVDNDLQKAIDDITNNTNSDPVFSDPVAAPSSIPEGDDGTLAEPVGPFPEPQPPVAPISTAPTPDLSAPAISNQIANDYSTYAPIPDQTIAEPIVESAIDSTPAHVGLGMHQVKEAALRDLVPLLDKVSLSPSQKFQIYRDMFENLRDYTVLEPAYRAATEIADERERAEALLYLVESIDKM